MKIKKIMAAAVAAVLTLSGSAVALSGCGGCDHVYRDKVITAPTCMTAGETERKCGLCGDIQKITVPADPNAHVYGEWQVSNPTQNATGTAVKECTLNSSHQKISVTLPRLPESGNGDYSDVRVTKQPTALSEGVRTYTYPHESGEISVNVAIPARGVETVADGVEAALESKPKVRSCQGEWGFSKVGTQHGGETPYEAHRFKYEFGENYTHIQDESESTERWLSLDKDGELWAFVQNSGGLVKETDKGFLNGNKIPLTFTDITNIYGAEELLNTLYKQAQIVRTAELEAGIPEKEISFKESVSRLGYTFSFGMESGGSTAKIQHYAQISVIFTLSDEFTLKTLKVESSILINHNDPEAPPLVTNWKKEENGKITILNPNGDKLIDKIELTQKTKTEVPAVPENPYAQEAVFLSSFDVLKTNGKPITEEEVIEISADTVYDYNVSNILPTTANMTFDPINVYLVRSDGEEVLLSFDSLGSKRVLGYYQSNAVHIRSQLAGEITLRVKSRNVTKTLHFNVVPKAPSRLYPAVWAYGDNGYFWDTETPDKGSKEVTVYVGQPLCFKVQPSQDELNYVETGYTAEITVGDKTSATIDSVVIKGEEVSRFVASKAGTYTVKCSTTYPTPAGKPKVAYAINIIVTELPDMSTYLAGSYFTDMTYPKRGRVNVDIEVTGANSATATIVNMEQNTEVLNLTFTETENGIALTSTHASGAKLGYTLSFNEAYRIVISYPNKYGQTESKVLSELEQS